MAVSDLAVTLDDAPADDTAPESSRTGTLLRFATAGSVDDGKSTLVGRLLHDSKAILADQLDAVTRTSTTRGFGGAAGGIDFALLTDGLRAEREQGITIDVAYRYFATDRRTFILADCPGHVQYTRNMVTGATTADAVIVLIDAQKGVLEQTRRHLSVISLLRVPHVIVAVNKIDLTDFSEVVFRDVERQVHQLAADLGLDSVHVIPVSALAGDNVVERSANTPWFEGPSILELLETLPSTDELEAHLGDFRLPVQLVIRPQGALAPGVDAASADTSPGAAPPSGLDAAAFRDYRAYAGQVASGTIRVGDEVEVSPGGARTVVTGIDSAGVSLDEAFAPQSVSLRVADDMDLARGAVIAAAGTLSAESRELAGRVFWFDPRPLVVGARVLVRVGTATVQAIVGEIAGRRDLDTLALVEASQLGVNDIGDVRLRLAQSLPLEPFAAHRRMGAFLVIDPHDGATLAAGTVGGGSITDSTLP